DVASKIAVVEI
ncbi:MAG: hypothetical protein K2I78_02760, partial [Clostridia bacterium]|nr:hypothetical protein [Clostridia bacterium]